MILTVPTLFLLLIPFVHTQPANCAAIENLTIDQVWSIVRLTDFDRYFILSMGFLSVLLMAVTCLTWVVYRSFSPPSDIIFLVCLAELIENSSILASAIFETVNNSPVMPPSFESFCVPVGIFNVIGNVTSIYYNAMFCIVLAYAVRNTIKKALFNPIKYHILSLIVIVTATLTLTLTQNVGEGLNGLCGYKVANKQSLGRFVVEIMVSGVCIFSMIKFKQKIPKNSYFQKQSDFGYYFYYMGIFSGVQLISSFSYLLGNICCRVNSSSVSEIIQYSYTVGNCVSILLSYVIFIMRMSNPVLQIKLRKLLFKVEDNKDHPDEEETSWIGCLIQSIKGSQILSFLSAITISFIENQSKVPSHLTPYHYSKHYVFPLNERVCDQYVTRRVSNRLSLLTKQKTDGLRTLDFQVVVYNPEVYSTLLQHEKIGALFQSFDIRKNISIVKKQSYTNGGKSGEFFFGTHDNRFIFKTIREDEAEVYLQKTKQFMEYFQANPDSLIVKILGMYKFTRKDIKEDNIYVMLMLNLTRTDRSNNLRVYDIKGSSFNRSTINENKLKKDDVRIKQMTLKDNDFLELEGKLDLPQQTGKELKRLLIRDIQFLGSMGVMDYSLLIVRRKGELQFGRGLMQVAGKDGEVMNFGVIDYLESWNLKRKAERVFKTMITKEEVTANSPEKYSQRLIQFINCII